MSNFPIKCTLILTGVTQQHKYWHTPNSFSALICWWFIALLWSEYYLPCSGCSVKDADYLPWRGWSELVAHLQFYVRRADRAWGFILSAPLCRKHRTLYFLHLLSQLILTKTLWNVYYFLLFLSRCRIWGSVWWTDRSFITELVRDRGGTQGAFWLWNPGCTDTLQLLRVEIGCLNRKEWRKLVDFVVLTMWFHWCPNLITWTFKTFLQLIAEEQVTLILSVRRVPHQGS